MASNESWYYSDPDYEYERSVPSCSLCHNLTTLHCHHTGLSKYWALHPNINFQLKF